MTKVIAVAGKCGSGKTITKTTKAGIKHFNDEINRTKLELIVTIPNDEEIVSFDLAGQPIYELKKDAKALHDVSEMVGGILCKIS